MQGDDWLLYVDESGDPDAVGQLHLVAGLLLRATDSAQLNRALRDAIRRVHPLWPWPPHAAHLNVPASRVAAALRPPGRGEGEEAASLRAACLPLVEAARRSEDPRAGGLVVAVRRWLVGQGLAWDAVRAADGWMRAEHRSAWRRVRSECLQQERQLQRLLSGLGQHAGATALFAVSPAWSEATDGPRSTPRRHVRRDRYVRALEVLLARATWLLAGRSPTARLFVATRHVEVGGKGVKSRRRALDPGLVLDIARSGVRDAPAAPDPPTLLPLGRPNRYDASVVPGIVLADWIANRARRALRAPGEPAASLVAHGALGAVEAPLPIDFLPLRGGDPLPTLASDGAARAVLRRALRGEPVRVDQLEPAWVRDVTAPWIAAAGEWR